MEVGYQVAGVIRRMTFNFVTVLLYNLRNNYRTRWDIVISVCYFLRRYKVLVPDVVGISAFTKS